MLRSNIADLGPQVGERRSLPAERPQFNRCFFPGEQGKAPKPNRLKREQRIPAPISLNEGLWPVLWLRLGSQTPQNCEENWLVPRENLGQPD